MATAFKVLVNLSWGVQREYLIANDVEPGLDHRYKTRDNWQDVIIDALINVPVGPYLPDNSVQPPIATGKVASVEAVDSDDPAVSGIQRTRSQFIMADIWRKQNADVNANFLRHDYDELSQKQIVADVDFWENGNRHPDVYDDTRRAIAAQEKRYAEQN
ncbi:MAG: hypothetical protein Q3959_01240 [Limosilactobacillus sp.]|uniref:DUF7679 family protein n=1 Tax=Limosilactobacillus sp. TaxID=2773925 RepID=UPI00270078BF|nr:hypothetical protein [Limosilactobacillus sp.]